MLEKLLLVCLLNFGFLVLHTSGAYPSTVLVEWVSVNYTWDSVRTYADYVENGLFLPENCITSGINVDIDGEIYVAVPRWREGVPATLNKLDQETFRLTPYPSWDVQDIGEEGDLQNCQSMTIDSKRRMWVIDVGRRNFFGSDPEEVVNQAGGIWIIDLETDEVLMKYYFPEDVVSYDASFLNDLVIDEDRDIAYITDAWGEGGIVVYDLKTNSSRRYSGSSTGPDSDYVMIINGVNYGNKVFITPIDGIAITEDYEAIFYSAVQGTELYRLNTAVLRDPTSTDLQIDQAVELIGYKEPTDGMKYFNGTLYWGALTTSTYYYLPINATNTPFLPTEQTMAPPSVENFHWIDTFAIDLQTEESLWFISNRIDQFLTGTMDFTGAQGANMRIIYLNLTESDATTTTTSTTTASTSTTSDDNDDEDDDDDGADYRTGFIVVMVLFSITIVGILFLVVRRQLSDNPERTPLL